MLTGQKIVYDKYKVELWMCHGGEKCREQKKQGYNFFMKSFFVKKNMNKILLQSLIEVMLINANRTSRMISHKIKADTLQYQDTNCLMILTLSDYQLAH